MKNLILLFSLLIITSTSFSQSHPPRKVKKAFEKHAPEAQDIKWKGEGERNKDWTASYTVDADSMRTEYDFKANWQMTLKFISIEELPEQVTKYIKESFRGAEFLVAAEMQEPGFDGYGVAFNYMQDRWAVAIDKEGKVFRRQITSEGF